MFDWDVFSRYVARLTPPERAEILRCFQQWVGGTPDAFEGASRPEMEFYHSLFQAGWVASQLVSGYEE